MKQSTSCLIYPQSTHAVFVSFPFFLSLCTSLSLSLSLVLISSEVWTSNWPISFIKSFVVGKCIFPEIFIIQNLNLHFKTLSSFPQNSGRPGSCTILWIFRFIHLWPRGLGTARILCWSVHDIHPRVLNSNSFGISLFEPLGLLHRRGIMSTCLLIIGVQTYPPPPCRKNYYVGNKNHHNHTHSQTSFYMMRNESM